MTVADSVIFLVGGLGGLFVDSRIGWLALALVGLLHLVHVE